MPEIKNSFSGGSMNKDLDERIVPKGQYRDAMNIQVSTSEESNVGTAQNILGNQRMDALNLTEAKCIGVIADEKNNALYYFITSLSLDAIIEFKTDEDTLDLYDGVVTPVLVDINKNVLKFSDNIITGINILDNLLFWTDNINEPRKINIDRCKEGSSDFINQTKLIVNQSQQGDIEEQDITVIKRKPSIPPMLTVNRPVGSVSVECFADMSDGAGNLLGVGQTGMVYIPQVSGGWSQNHPGVILGLHTSTAGGGPMWNPAGVVDVNNLQNSYTDPYTQITYGPYNTPPLGPFLAVDQIGIIKSFQTGVSLTSNGNAFAIGAEIIGPHIPQGATIVDIQQVFSSVIVELDMPMNYGPTTLAAYMSSWTTQFQFKGWGPAAPDYQVGDVLILSQSSIPGVLPSNYQVRGKIISITNGIDNDTATIGYQEYEIEILGIDISVPSTNVTISNGNVASGLEMDVMVEFTETKLFEDQFIRFATRWKYEDGEYSAFSPFTQVAFNTSSFGFHSLKNVYNVGMENECKTIDLTHLIPPDLPKDVVQVDILSKFERSTNVYSIDSIKADDPVPTGEQTNYWNANVNPEIRILSPVDSVTGGPQYPEEEQYLLPTGYKGKYTVSNSNIYAALPANQLLRPWDNVPKKAVSQEVTGNRIVYGNYVQNYNLPTPQEVIANYRQRSVSGNETFNFPKGRQSLKSLRNYQLGIIYGDKYGRETPIFTSRSGSITIPFNSNPSGTFLGNASNSTQLTTQLKGVIPDFAKYFKFFVKQTTGEYYNLSMDRVYRAEDPENLWISFPSSDVNKLQEGDYISIKKKVDLDEQVPIENKYKVIDIKNEAPDYVKFNYLPVGNVGGDTPSTLLSNLYVGFASGVDVPEEGGDTFTIDKTTWNAQDGASISTVHDKLVVQFEIESGGITARSERYEVIKITESGTGTSAQYKIKLGKAITVGDSWVSTGGTVDSTLKLKILKQLAKSSVEFEGRFFVKIITNAITDTYITPLIAQNSTYKVVDSLAAYWFADNQSANTGSYPYQYDEGLVNTTYDWSGINTAGTSAVELHLNPDNKSNLPGDWEKLLQFGGGNSKGGWFIDNAYMAAGQMYNDLDSSESGTIWKNFGNNYPTQPPEEGYIDGLEGIVTIDPTSDAYATPTLNSPVGGFRSWRDSLSGWDWDDTYNGTQFDNNGNHFFMHVSYGFLGSDLFEDGDFAAWNPGSQSGSFEWKGILGDNASWVTSTGTQHSPNSSSSLFETIWQDQWEISLATDHDIAQRFSVDAQFKFEGGETIFTIKKVTKKWLYNHTPFNTMQAHDGTSAYDRTDSVQYAYEQWAASNYTDATDAEALYDKLVDFGSRTNRRICYIIELDKDPTNPVYNNDPRKDVDSSEKIRFIEPSFQVEETVTAINPTIWETQAKEDVDLNIYYEASNAVPTTLNTPNKSNSEMFAPVGSRVWCSKPNSMFDLTNYPTTKFVITDWKTNSNGIYNVVEIQSPGLNVDTNYSIDGPGQTDAFNGEYVRFFRDDGSFVTAQIYAVPDDGIVITSGFDGFVTKLNLMFHTDTLCGLSYYNCFTFGNGVESSRIRDDYNEVFITNGVKASTVLEAQYKEERRKNGLIYSGLYNSTSGVNNLNQFIQAEKITKDLNPSYGSIQKLFQRRISLVAFCEDRVIKILSNKDALYNADGNQQLVATNAVLGDANPFVGDFGISKNPESFAKDSYRAYFTDKQRGAVCRLSMDGITAISNNGMVDYFKDNMKTSAELIGSFDDYKSNYNLTLLQRRLGEELILNGDFLTGSGSELLVNEGFDAQEWSPNFLLSPNFETETQTYIDWTGGNIGPSEQIVWRNHPNQTGGVMDFGDPLGTPTPVSAYHKLNQQFDPSTILAGKRYQIQFQVSNYGGGELIGKLVDSVGNFIKFTDHITVNAGGTYTINAFMPDFNVVGGTQLTSGWWDRFFVESDGSFIGTVDTMVVKERRAKEWDASASWRTSQLLASHIGGTGYLSQTLNNSLTTGKEYEFQIEVVTDDGDMYVNHSNGNFANELMTVNNGVASVIWDQLVDTTNIGISNLTGTGTGAYDNASLMELSIPLHWGVDAAGGNYVRKIGNSVRLYHNDNNATSPHTNIHTLNPIIEPGIRYKWSVEITDQTSGFLNFYIGSNPTITGDTFTADGFQGVGIHEGYLISGHSSDYILYIKRGTRDNDIVDITFTNVSLREAPIVIDKTISFNENTKGWTSFKSFIPDLAESMGDNYYTLKEGGLYLHHVPTVDRNTFYGSFIPSSVNCFLNDQPTLMKNFNTLNYEGTQSKVDEFIEKTLDDYGNVIPTITDNQYYNLNSSDGWYVESVITNKQSGSINEFIEKEGKWFNYIKGSSDVVDESAFNFQGIGMLNEITVL